MRIVRVAVTVAFATFFLIGTPEHSAAEPKMALIDGGSYPIGSGEGTASARPPHRVSLAPFLIDVFEVTNVQFAAFLDTLEVAAKRDIRAGELRPDDVTGPDADRLWGGSGGNDRAYIEMDDTDARIGIIDSRLAPEPGFANHPVSESTWPGAVVYCAWRGARLPTEAEWEASARGKEGRTYPWGEAPPTPELAVFGRGRGETDPVGSHPKGATPEGVLDLSGNEAEWTSSLSSPIPTMRMTVVKISLPWVSVSHAAAITYSTLRPADSRATSATASPATPVEATGTSAFGAPRTQVRLFWGFGLSLIYEHRMPQESLVVFDIETITDNDHHDGDGFTHEHRSEFAC